eukprot:CAMPEP_0177793156 /NCGR_PEP_ID=MMETSP0491_2-20121128/24920_1 /TAXON_ID=63592 /ORGANISM="Tetraselmis chuii, Strain PLY429" /LENGTH=737 /DNA_ID=CAMNT_0019315643 /DNA_START=296 /DNA_END=2512 /DNA_ORIENTATION=+
MHQLSLGGNEEAGLFGVFDGHGGQEVALFVAKHLLAEFEQCESYRQQDYRQALHDVFLRLDEMIADKERWPELRELAECKRDENPMTMDENDLPEYLNRALIAAKQRHREMVGDEDEEEMEDEVGDPNFDPDLQDSDDVDSELERSESETEITTPSYLKWQSFPEPGHGRGREKLSGSEHEVEAEESPRRGGSSRQMDTRPIESVADGIGGMKMASPTASGWSDGEYDYDYEDYDEDNYSSDDFDSFEDSGDLSMSGKRMNSPLRRPKSKDGKRPRGSRPGSSDSRPRSAPASRPASGGPDDRLSSPSFSKSSMGLFSTSRLKPAETSDSGEPSAENDAAAEAEYTPEGDDAQPTEDSRPNTPSIQINPPEALEPQKPQTRQRPRSAATPFTPSFGYRRPKTAAAPSTPGGSGQKKSRPKTASALGYQDLEDDAADLAGCSITKGEEEEDRAPVADATDDLKCEATSSGLNLPVPEAAAAAASAGSAPVQDEVGMKAEPSVAGVEDDSDPVAGGASAVSDKETESATLPQEPCSPEFSESEDNDEGRQEHETLDPDAPTAGCTAVVAMVCGRTLLVANAGDSRCVCSREGVAQAMTEDHKPGNPEELRRVLKAGGMVAEGRIMGSLNLSRALGDLEFKTAKGLGPEAQMVTPVPEVRELELTEGDEFLVLACDGIWDVLSNQEVVTFVRSSLLAGSDPKSVCEQLCDRCCAKDTESPERGCDNLSCMVVLFKELWQS